jgi:hypothetical protein
MVEIKAADTSLECAAVIQPPWQALIARNSSADHEAEGTRELAVKLQEEVKRLREEADRANALLARLHITQGAYSHLFRKDPPT